MDPRPPAEVGMALAEVDTPALLIELDAFEANLKRLADAVAASPLRLRPHAKAHKCPIIAHKRMALGAVGVCCQKVSEAEAMVQGGVPDILVSNEIVGEGKIRRLAALAGEARVATCIDRIEAVASLGAAARSFGATLGVLVEIDVGQNRCGVAPGAAAVPLARAAAETGGLAFLGLQAYHGSAQHFRTFDERRRAIEEAAAKVEATLAALDKAGLAAATVTGGGTGTYPFEIASGIYTELQAGSYIFMDGDYGRNHARDGGPFADFRQALFVLATVISHPRSRVKVLVLKTDEERMLAEHAAELLGV